MLFVCAKAFLTSICLCSHRLNVISSVHFFLFFFLFSSPAQAEESGLISKAENAWFIPHNIMFDFASDSLEMET